MNRAAGVMGLMLVAGCSSSPGERHGAITAGAAARAYGIAAYSVVGGHVAVYDEARREVGTIEVTVPSKETRNVTYAHPGGDAVRIEVVRPLPDGSFLAPMKMDLEGAVIADPSLADYFATYQLRFRPLVTPASRPADGLEPSAFVKKNACTDYTRTFPAGCSNLNCAGGIDSPWYSSSYIADSVQLNTYPTPGCAAACSYGGLEYDGQRIGATSNCECRQWNTYGTHYAACTPNPSNNCTNGYSSDLVSADAICISPGSCSNYESHGWTGYCACGLGGTCDPSSGLCAGDGHCCYGWVCDGVCYLNEC